MLVTTIITIPTFKSPMLPIGYHGYCISSICATLIPISQATASVICCYSLQNINPLAYTDVPETAGLARSINP